MSTGTGKQHLRVWRGRKGRPSEAPPVGSLQSIKNGDVNSFQLAPPSRLKGLATE